MKSLKRIAQFVIGAALLLALGVAVTNALRVGEVLVDTAAVERRTMRVLASDDGTTRVRERYVISAPVAGHLLRVVHDPGERVTTGETLLAEFVPVAPELLDDRARAEAEARLARARAALSEARARRDRHRAEVEFGEREVDRLEKLGTLEARRELERANRDLGASQADLRTAEFSIQVARHELELAEASLVEPAMRTDAATSESTTSQTPGLDGQPEATSQPGATDAERRVAERSVPIVSPIDGRVLRVFEESARTLPAGAPILEIGNTGTLEIVADFLSQDAVEIESGMRVLVRGWSRERREEASAPSLLGVVRLVEPGGFTKVSALGVEEQRVNVIIDPVDVAGGESSARWERLGDGYHVEVDVVLWEADEVVVVPTGALFRERDQWFVFTVEEDVARKRSVTVGHRSGLDAEVLGGLEPGSTVILYPSSLLDEGTPVQDR